jgi:hypothetical protein
MFICAWGTLWTPRRTLWTTEYISLQEMKQGQCICPLSLSVHCNFTGDGKCNKKGVGVHPLPPPARANFTLITECTPESSRCHSVYSVLWTAGVRFCEMYCENVAQIIFNLLYVQWLSVSLFLWRQPLSWSPFLNFPMEGRGGQDFVRLERRGRNACSHLFSLSAEGCKS